MPLCIENSDKCIKPRCFLKRCKEQSDFYCFPHAMLFFAQSGLPIVDMVHAQDVILRGVTHFAAGFVIIARYHNGFHYAVPAWHYVRQN